jgi:hypothetical protein
MSPTTAFSPQNLFCPMSQGSVCMHVHTHTHIRTYVCLHIHIHVHIHTYICIIYIYTHTHSCIYCSPICDIIIEPRHPPMSTPTSCTRTDMHTSFISFTNLSSFPVWPGQSVNRDTHIPTCIPLLLVSLSPHGPFKLQSWRHRYLET